MAETTRYFTDMMKDRKSGQRLDALLVETVLQGINPMIPPAPLVAAKGDGVTDDTAKIQAIIDNMTNGGRIILTKKFKVTTINLKSNVFILGIGQETSGFVSDSANVITVPNLSVRWGLQNFGIWGSISASTGLNLAGAAGGIADFSIRDLYITNCKIGVKSTFAWAFEYSRVRFQGCEKALQLDTQSNQGVFTACSFKVTKQVVTFSNCSSLTFTGCEFAGNNHDGTIPFTFFQSSAINFIGNYVETFASNSPLMLIGALSQTVPCKAITYRGNLTAYVTNAELFRVYECDGLDISNNQIDSTVTYIINDMIGNVKGLNVQNNPGFPSTKVSENLIPNHNFFAWTAGTATMPNNFTSLSATASRNATDGSLELVTAAANGGLYVTLNETVMKYLSWEIEAKSSVDNTVIVDMFINGVYTGTKSFTVTANTYTKKEFKVYVNSSTLTFFRVRFLNAGTHNIKSAKAYRGLMNVETDINVKRLCNNIPTHGDFLVKDNVENTTPSASGYEKWVCVAAGNPGTWKGVGLIQA